MLLFMYLDIYKWSMYLNGLSYHHVAGCNTQEYRVENIWVIRFSYINTESPI